MDSSRVFSATDRGLKRGRSSAETAAARRGFMDCGGPKSDGLRLTVALVATTLLVAGIGISSANAGLAIGDEIPDMPGPPRLGHSSVVDPEGDRVFVFGGRVLLQGQLTRTADLLIYDLNSRSWASEMSGETPGPSARYGQAMAIDLRAGAIYVVGGNAGTGLRERCLGDLWRYGIQGHEWENLDDGHGGMPGVVDARAVAVGAAGDLWLTFGRCDFEASSALFRWNAEDRHWTGYRTRSPGPVERFGHAFAYDASRDEILVWGGAVPIVILVPGQEVEWKRLWSWNRPSGTWTLLADGQSGPADARVWSVSGYDEVSDLFLVFGGSPSRSTNFTHLPEGDLWGFDRKAGQWRLLRKTDERLRRTQASGGYCPCQGGLFVSGGIDSSADHLSDADVHTDAHLIPVEMPASMEWEGDGRGAGSENRSRWARVSIQAPRGQGSAIVVGSVALIDCATGRRLALPSKMERTPANEWRFKFERLDGDVVESAGSGHLRLTGRVEGSPVNFLAMVSWPWSREPGRGQSLRTAQNGDRGGEWRQLSVKYEHGAWVFRRVAGASDGEAMSIFDLAGRRVWSRPGAFAGSPGQEAEVRWDGHSTEGVRLPAGLYFVRVLGPEGTVRAKIALP